MKGLKNVNLAKKVALEASFFIKDFEGNYLQEKITLKNMLETMMALFLLYV